MKRIITVAGVVVALLGIGATAALAGDSSEPNAVCRNGTPNETTVPGTSFGLEWGTTGGNETGVTVCYSDTPDGTPSNVAGGFVHVRQDRDGDTYLWCVGDGSGDVTATCFSDGYVRTTDPNSGTPGTTASAKVILSNGTLGQTGAELNPSTSTNAPASGAAGSGGSLGIGTGTCTYVNGGTPTCPFGFTVAGVTVNEADLIPSVTLYTPTPPCTGVNNTCVPVGATVRILDDTSNPTLTVQTATSPPTNIDVAPTGLCVQVNATC